MATTLFRRATITGAAFLAATISTAAWAAAPWTSLVEQALTDFAAVDRGNQSAMGYAFAADATARLHGWDDPQTKTYLDRLYALRNPDGGWGVNRAWDAFGDGTTNPASTTYTVTLAGHVGPVLLDGFKAGAIPRADVQKVVDLVASTPRIDTTAGYCVAYSRSPYDVKPGYCVHNVNAGAAAFLIDAQQAGVGNRYTNTITAGVTRREMSAYQPGPRAWSYSDRSPTLNDAAHNAYQAESMLRLAPMIGRQVALHQQSIVGGGTTAPLAHLQLASLPAGQGGPDWCELATRWADEINTYAAAQTAGDRLAQVAHYAARANDVCS